jgi:molecular chaperone GrpE
MAPDSNDKRSNRIPIRFMDAEPDAEKDSNPEAMDTEASESESDSFTDATELSEVTAADEVESASVESEGGPITAELVATRAELKRVQEENAELKDRLARRQADFENYRKRVDRERTETYNRVVADVASKLLGVLDNLKRALETEASVEAVNQTSLDIS